MHLAFVCVGNSCRSQMAEAIARSMGFEASSAGTHPASAVAEHALTVLNARGINASGLHPKGIEAVDTESADMIISMGCGVSCPALPIVEDWGLDDPVGGPLSLYEATADEITRRLEAIREAHSSSS
ncbi:MAG: arsenate reductase ArsC [Candidatus Thermoplasmatota archaeon]|nr:arsenate reductase ArsC [Candidatus Thermoplasmatota archaeon]